MDENEVEIIEWLEQRKHHWNEEGFPLVTISYAQTLDGSLTVRRGMPTGLSGPQSQRMTHRLRANHDAILVGIGTVLADDPQLTVRLVSGDHPQPVVLDSRLRIPLECQLLRRRDRQVWVACAKTADISRQYVLQKQGIELIGLSRRGDRGLDLAELLKELYQRGIRSVMVEGGAKVITSFLAERLAHLAIVTIVPRWLGGLNVIAQKQAVDGLPYLENVQYRLFGKDILIFGDLVWGKVE